MNKAYLCILFVIIQNMLFSQENDFFLKLRNKDLATFNDAITCMKLVFDENDDNDIFIQNALWAAEKKLFRVTIPIDPNAINPVISRKEFAYWICRISEIGGSTLPITKFEAYKRCVAAGIIFAGRGAEDSFSGIELMDTFAYFDYYVRSNNVKMRFEHLPLYDDEYTDIPQWRKKLYEELDEQRAYEKKLRDERKTLKKEKKKEKKTTHKESTESPDVKIVE